MAEINSAVDVKVQIDAEQMAKLEVLESKLDEDAKLSRERIKWLKISVVLNAIIVALWLVWLGTMIGRVMPAG